MPKIYRDFKVLKLIISRFCVQAVVHYDIVDK